MASVIFGHEVTVLKLIQSRASTSVGNESLIYFFLIYFFNLTFSLNSESKLHMGNLRGSCFVVSCDGLPVDTCDKVRSLGNGYYGHFDEFGCLE